MKSLPLEQFKLFLKNPKNVEALKKNANKITKAEHTPIQPLTDEQQKLVSQAIANLRKTEINHK